MHQHQWHDGQTIELPTGKIVCVGRNYAAHAKELNNPIPDSPILFIKPNTCFQPLSNGVHLAKRFGEHHYEAELALLIGKQIDADTQAPLEHIQGVGLALDTTIRSLQSELKSKGYPWERAKAYDGSCPISAFYPVTDTDELNHAEYRFWLNGTLAQHGKTAMMLFNIETLLKEIAQTFTLLPGDVVLTGTPEGVGVLNHNDQLTLQYQDYAPVDATVTIA